MTLLRPHTTASAGKVQTAGATDAVTVSTEDVVGRSERRPPLPAFGAGLENMVAINSPSSGGPSGAAQPGRSIECEGPLRLFRNAARHG